MTEGQDDILASKVKGFLIAMAACFKKAAPEEVALTELAMQVSYLAFLLKNFPKESQKELVIFISSINLLRLSQINALMSLLSLESE